MDKGKDSGWGTEVGISTKGETGGRDLGRYLEGKRAGTNRVHLNTEKMFE